MSALPSVRNAKLPTVYVEAQKALAHCNKIDECKEWADKAAAIASYAKQAQDQTLMDTATRIKARAIRRCGQLLKAIERSDKGGRPQKNGGGMAPVSRAAAAKSAGLSRDQRRDALRVANVPEADFEAAVESRKPPTVTQLSEAGKREAANRAYRLAPKPPGFKDATQLLGTLERFAEFCNRADATVVAEALSQREAKRVRRDVQTVTTWLKNLRKRIG